jgi:putative membrane protein
LEEKEKSADSQFIQQHLANERTFLAWVRTAIAVVGVGFLAAGVAFRSSYFESLGHVMAVVAGIGSVLLGGLVISCATREYFVKRRTINDSTFRAPSLSIWVIFASLGIIDVFLMVLVIVLLL